MKVDNRVFDEFHIEHPHRMQFSKLAERKLHLRKRELNALKRGATLECPDGHKMVLTPPRTVRPWINWRREFEDYAPAEVEKILAKNKPKKVRFVEIS